MLQDVDTFKPRTRKVSETNPFVLEDKQYKRDVFPIKHAVDQYAWMLHLQVGIGYTEARAWVSGAFTQRKFNYKNPIVEFLRRGENGDRFKDELPLTKYLQEVLENKEILAPTFTSYVSSDKYKSILGGYIRSNLKKRAIAKKAMFAAKQRKDHIEEFFQELEQRNTKLSNNAISGAHATPSTPLYNQTNHSTLTSNCRMTSGNGNANNEKMLSGNRHYWAPYIVINDIYSITQNTEYDYFQAVMDKYNLYYPTAQDMMDVITYSSDLYWISNKHLITLRQICMTLTPIQRAAFVYTGDLYHVRKYNSDFVKGFIKSISTKTLSDDPQPHVTLEKYPEDYVCLGHQICCAEWAGEGKEYKKMFESGEKLTKLQLLSGTVEGVYKGVMEHADFIRVIFVSENTPASVPYFPTSVRRSALTSDTDSTIFTVQEWVIWYCGKMDFTPKGTSVAGAMIFLAAQAINHILARMSINCGVSYEDMWLIAMKNEFFFLIFSPTEVAKHYWALIQTQEGNVYDEPEMEYKGVHLKSSNAPREIIDGAQAMMKFICTEVIEGREISLTDLLTEVGVVERTVVDFFKKSDSRYSRKGEIKSPDSYTQDESISNYRHHTFWKEVFADKYGFNEEPPYQVVKLSGAHNTPRDTQRWLEGLDVTSPDVARRVRLWMKKNNKKKMGAFWVPKGHADVYGIPDELMDAINVRKLTADITSIYYLLLRNVGYYGLDKKLHMMISDRYGIAHEREQILQELT